MQDNHAQNPNATRPDGLTHRAAALLALGFEAEKPRPGEPHNPLRYVYTAPAGLAVLKVDSLTGFAFIVTAKVYSAKLVDDLTRSTMQLGNLFTTLEAKGLVHL